ncbi:MAG: ABC transporter ATP-binding protein [Pseudomonadota bacterium]
MNKSAPLLEAVGVTKTYHQGDNDLQVLQDITCNLYPGEMVALVGPSGAGKSTLLHILGLLDTPSTGTLRFDGQDVAALDDAARTTMRRQKLGFIYQFHYLQPEFDALENVVLPQLITGKSMRDARDHAAELLRGVGLGHRLDHRPARLSGGEQQRVAICRALANNPSLLLADEPTGNLDPETSAEVFAMLQSRVKQAGISALIATHNMDLAARMDRRLVLRRGAVYAE